VTSFAGGGQNKHRIVPGYTENGEGNKEQAQAPDNKQQQEGILYVQYRFGASSAISEVASNVSIDFREKELIRST